MFLKTLDGWPDWDWSAQQQAIREGWGLFIVRSNFAGPRQIQKIDDPNNWNLNATELIPNAFVSDEEAVEWVSARANEGSELHKQAFALHMKDWLLG